MGAKSKLPHSDSPPTRRYSSLTIFGNTDTKIRLHRGTLEERLIVTVVIKNIDFNSTNELSQRKAENILYITVCATYKELTLTSKKLGKRKVLCYL